MAEERAEGQTNYDKMVELLHRANAIHLDTYPSHTAAGEAAASRVEAWQVGREVILVQVLPTRDGRNSVEIYAPLVGPTWPETWRALARMAGVSPCGVSPFDAPGGPL